jgi:hypothetical protein
MKKREEYDVGIVEALKHIVTGQERYLLLVDFGVPD